MYTQLIQKNIIHNQNEHKNKCHQNKLILFLVPLKLLPLLMRMHINILSGKSSKNPASAIGVQNTKNDQVNSPTNNPLSSPYFMDTKLK